MSKTQELLTKLQALHSKIDHEKWSMPDLDEMVNISSALYERAVILRYKVIEQNILTPETESISLSTEEEQIEKEEEKEESIVMTELDFGIFEEMEKEKVETPEIEFSEPPLFSIEEELEPEPAFEFVSQEEPAIVHEPEPEVLEEAEEEEEIVKEEFEAELPAEDLFEETTEEPEPMEESTPVLPEVDASSAEVWKNYFIKQTKETSSGFRTLLSSISGSFGMNERLLYINELFNGDAEAFSESVKLLDTASSWEDCLTLMSKIAIQQEWDKQSETVTEFLVHVQRKHV